MRNVVYPKDPHPYDFADRPIRTLVCATSAFEGVAAAGVGRPGVRTLPALDTPPPPCSGPTGITSQTTYDAVGNALVSVDLMGHERRMTYDALYRPVIEESPRVLGEDIGSGVVLKRWVTRRRYDLAGRVIEERDGNGAETTTTYDPLGRVARVVDAKGRTTERFYDGNDNLRREESSSGGVIHRTRIIAYDAMNRVLGTEDRVSGAQTYTTVTRYDDLAHTVATKDARGFVTLQRLDDLDRVFEVTADVTGANSLTRAPQTDPLLQTALNLSTKTAFDSNGNQVKVEDPQGRSLTQSYDGLSRLRRRDSPMGVFETFDKYDGEGTLLQWTDVRGFRYEASFDVVGRKRVTSVQESLSNGGANVPLALQTTTYDDVPDSLELLTKREDRDARGNTTSTYVDGLGRVVRVKDPLLANGQEYKMEMRHDAKAKRVEVDKKGFITRYGYDTLYRLVSQSEEEGATTVHQQTWAFNDDARTVTQVDRGGVTTVATADGLGRVVSTRRGPSGGLQQLVEHRFDADGRDVETTDANGHRTARVFDGAGRAVRAVKGLTAGCGLTCVGREEVVSVYDNVGNLLEAKSLRSTGVSYDVRTTYDDLNRAVRVEDAVHNVTSKAYDAAGNLVCVKGPKGAGHAAHGWASGKSLDEVRNVACGQTNSDAFVTRYTWDELGKQTSVTDPNGSQWRFLYDANRNLVPKLDANQHLTRYRFDARNQRTEELQYLANSQALPSSRASLPTYVSPSIDFTSGTLRTSWSYDANGQLEDEVDPKGQTKHHEYGLLKRLKQVTYSGHVEPRAYPSMESIAYTYRPEGEVETCTEVKAISSSATGSADGGTGGGSAGGSGGGLAAGGPPQTVSEVTRHFYDVLERRVGTERYDGYSLTYGYDLKGNRTLVRDENQVETSYTYDANDRLKTATTPLGVATFSYLEDGLLQRKQYSAPSGLVETRSYQAVEVIALGGIDGWIERL